MRLIDRCVIATRLFRHYRSTGLPLRYSATRAWRMAA